MNIHATTLVYFSPTKTTKKVLEGILQGIGTDTVKHIDLTPPAARTGTLKEMHDELVIIGSPVYGGRIPLDAVSRFKLLKAKGTPAVIVAVYGNREYEDALLELSDLAVERGFIPVAAGAFIGEHSFANDTFLIANGRPDFEDLNRARKFGMMIRKKMNDIQTLDDLFPLKVPGNSPYQERMKPFQMSPSTQKTLCTLCATCATVCPTAAITVNDSVMTDLEACILCCACVKNCPAKARILEQPQNTKGGKVVKYEFWYSQRA